MKHIVQAGTNSSHKPWVFWDENFNYSYYDDITNLNNVNLLYSATYNSDNYPSGSLDWRNHYMLGFYKWDGYRVGVVDENGYVMSENLKVHSAFYAP